MAVPDEPATGDRPVDDRQVDHRDVDVSDVDEIAALRGEVAGLRTAMTSRATIEQAKGILMGAEHCSAEEAFGMLVRASQRENRKLADIAAEIVERRSRRGSAGP